jgi:RNA polymerase sigma factor (sigma-70 family)
MGNLIDYLRGLVHAGGVVDRTDGQLLKEYISHREEAALAALVRRHGPMVWGVCRRVLGNHHDAEDAFQATFLVLVRKAASIMPREMIGNWLYGVAHQTARKTRATTAKRQARERQVKAMPEPEAMPEPDLWPELEPLLDGALSRLPDKYRAVIVLCDLEGKTRKAVARQLKIPEGTLSSRLTTARTLLAKRLGRYGLAISAGVLATIVSHQAASAGVPGSVVCATIKAASLFAAGQAAATGALSAKVLAVAEGVLKTMYLTKLKMAIATGFVIACLYGAGTVVSQAQDAASTAEGAQAAGRSDNSPLKDFLLTLDKQLWEAAGKGDWKVYQTLLAHDYFGFSPEGRYDKSSTVEAVKRRRYSDWTIRDVDFSRVSRDVAILAYVYDCNVKEGETTQHYRDHRASFTWAQRDGVWVLVFSQDTIPPDRGRPWERRWLVEPMSGIPDDFNAKQQKIYQESVDKARELFAARWLEKGDAVVWGKEVDGLQAGLGMRAGPIEGDMAKEAMQLLVRIRNVGKSPVAIAYQAGVFRDFAPTVRDKNGQNLRVSMPPLALQYMQKIEKTLKPGEDVEVGNEVAALSRDGKIVHIYLPQLGVADPNTKPPQSGVSFPTVYAPAGVYRISYRGFIQNHPQLSTGEVRVEIGTHIKLLQR